MSVKHRASVKKSQRPFAGGRCGIDDDITGIGLDTLQGRHVVALRHTTEAGDGDAKRHG